MKKILAAGILAICAIAVSQQQASAWVNSRFSIGLSYDVQAANNSFFWGLWRNGATPGCDQGFGPGAPHCAPKQAGFGPSLGYSGDGMMQPAFAPPMHAMMQPTFAPQYAYAPAMSYPTNPSYGPAMQPSFANPYATPYQFANYAQPTYYAPAPAYYYYGW